MDTLTLYKPNDKIFFYLSNIKNDETQTIELGGKKLWEKKPENIIHLYQWINTKY